MENQRTLFMTGYPGFISVRLLPELLRDRTYSAVVLLCEKAQAVQARRLAGGLELSCPVEVIEGDITRPGLGIENKKALEKLLSQPSEWWHLAALYRLDIDLATAHRVNVEGTRQVIETALLASPPPRFHYVSTAYVSGLAGGRFYESELPPSRPENFKNHYEHTKNEAEWEVRKRKELLPTTIYRPAIVTGDSQTGTTQKFDGPFLTIQYLSRMGRLPVPRIGAMKAPLNIVPVDYLVAAMTRVSGLDSSIHGCYHIVDPDPVSSGRYFDLVAEALGRPRSRRTVSAERIEGLMRFRAVRRFIGMPQQAIRYINHAVDYDCSNTTRALQGSGLRCPSLVDYVDKLVAFYLENKHRRELRVPIG